MNKYKILTCGLAIFLCACASNIPKNLALEKITHADQQIPDGWLLPVKEKTSDPAEWAQIYDDPILVAYLRRAKKVNFDIRIAQSRVEQAEADLKRARSLFKPRADVSVTASGASPVKDLGNIADAYTVGMNGRWSPDVFGKTRLVAEQSRAALAAQKALSADIAQAVLASTARAYIRAVEAEMQVSLAKTNLDFLRESRRISEARYRLGDTAKGAYAFAEANYQ
ncbi:MAG TPA: TolC family protein, partial [Hellea balneolensis]|nr:TolC family protein [Hellea balneolensis]